MAFLIDKSVLLLFQSAIEEQEAVLNFIAAGIDANLKACQPLANFMEPYLPRVAIMKQKVRDAKEILEDVNV